MDGSWRFPLVMLKRLSQQMSILSTVCPAMPKILSCTSHSNDSFVSAQQTIKPKIEKVVIDDCNLGNWIFSSEYFEWFYVVSSMSDTCMCWGFCAPSKAEGKGHLQRWLKASYPETLMRKMCGRKREWVRCGEPQGSGKRKRWPWLVQGWEGFLEEATLTWVSWITCNVSVSAE